MGVVGGGHAPWQQDAHRNTPPIRYWTGIVALALGASFSTAGFIYVVWIFTDLTDVPIFHAKPTLVECPFSTETV
jgi:hypothetical protein